jgi:hypothetical protein
MKSLKYQWKIAALNVWKSWIIRLIYIDGEKHFRLSRLGFYNFFSSGAQMHASTFANEALWSFK